MSKKAADICRKAADIIQKRGIAKGAFIGFDDSVCMYGALNLAAGHVVDYNFPAADTEDIMQALHRRFRPGLPFVPGYLPGASEFNDLTETTAEDVAKVLLQVADELEVQ